MSKLKVINLFAGPGASKSTTRAGLFCLMKQNMVSVEEVTEYAKDVVWDGQNDILADQLYVAAHQNHRLHRLQSKVKWSVSDSPLLLSIRYASVDFLPIHFRNLIWELWEQYDNYNFFINRAKPYVQAGRVHTEEQARKIDQDILDMLRHNHVPFMEIVGDSSAPKAIFDNLKPLFELKNNE